MRRDLNMDLSAWIAACSDESLGKHGFSIFANTKLKT